MRGHTWSATLGNMQTGEGWHRPAHRTCCTLYPEPLHQGPASPARQLCSSHSLSFFLDMVSLWISPGSTHYHAQHSRFDHTFLRMQPCCQAHMTARHCLVTYHLVDGRVGSLLFLLCACHVCLLVCHVPRSASGLMAMAALVGSDCKGDFLLLYILRLYIVSAKT